jgi:hypothetical protein
LANHAARRRLLRYQALDARFAQDIGLTPSAIVMECHAPFWVMVGRVKRSGASCRTAAGRAGASGVP